MHTYITSVMEVIHRLSKQLKWDSSKPKVQAITLGEERNPRQPIKRRTKRKVKERVKVNPRAHLFPIKEKERVEKVKERTNQKERAIMLVGRTGIKELPPFPSRLHQPQVQRLSSMDKRSDLSSVSITRHRRDAYVARIVCIYIKTIQ